MNIYVFSKKYIYIYIYQLFKCKQKFDMLTYSDKHATHIKPMVAQLALQIQLLH